MPERLQIKVRLSADELRPEHVGADELLSLIGALQRAVVQEADQSGADPSMVPLSLVAIEEGSVRLFLSIPLTLLPVVAALFLAVHEGDFSRVSTSSHQSLYDMATVAHKHGWTVTLAEGGDHGLNETIINPHEGIPAPTRRQPIRGQTVLVGTCVTAGGATPKVDVRPMEGGGLQHVVVSQAMAQELARSLYDVVALEGMATWDPETLALLEFSAERIAAAPSRAPLTEAFAELASVSNGRWDGVDHSAFVQALRSDDDRS